MTKDIGVYSMPPMWLVSTTWMFSKKPNRRLLLMRFREYSVKRLKTLFEASRHQSMRTPHVKNTGPFIIEHLMQTSINLPIYVNAF